MLGDLKKEFSSFRLLAILLTIAVSIYLLQIFWQVLGNFSDVIVIVVIAWLLSFILEPLVDFICKLSKLPKLWSSLFVYGFFAVLFAVLIFIFLPLVINEFQSISQIAPKYLSSYPKFIQTWNNTVTGSLDNLVSFIPSLANIFINIILILILSFYLIIDREKINEEIYKLAPRKWHNNLKFIQKTIDETFVSFLQIQVIFGVFAAITTWIVLTVFGVNFAASVSLLAGLLTIIPLVGPILAIIPPVFVVLATDPNNITKAALIFAILLLAQQIIFNAVGPKLMGNAFKLHPIIVFLSIILGFKIAGPLGAVFVVPVLGITVIVLKKLGYYFINPPQTPDK